MLELNKKAVVATKWSGFTEVVTRLISPITSMVLARLLTPDAFGVVTTLTMIISFAELFSDAGFQKYLVQHEFRDDVDLDKSTNVAFWSNFFMSMVIWGLIASFAEPLAVIVGSPGMGTVLIIACVSIPLAAFSSIQMALYKRNLDFKTLFKVRFVSILIPLVVTIPLAFWIRSYWALIIGSIVQNLFNAILLTAFSRWKPSLFFSFSKLSEMLSFTIWSLIEAVSIWLTNYVDVFIVGTMLNQYYLGLYKTSIVTVGHITGLIIAATTPVLFSSLSRLQDDPREFKHLFLIFQKYVGLLVIPIGVGIYCFSDLITIILLGNQWKEASGFIGLWGLTSAVTIVFSHYASEVYRAKGKPKLSVLAQWLHIIVLWPVVLFAVRYGFETLYIARSWIRIELIVVNLIILFFLVHISFRQMLCNVLPSLLASAIMAFCAFLLKEFFGESLTWQFIYILFCSFIYFLIIMMIPKERLIFKTFIFKSR